MPTVRVRESCVVHMDGAPLVLRKDEPFDTRDPVVREFPDFFVSDVEQATAAPGEKRSRRT